MGRLTRSYDWASKPLGAPETWPQSLKTAVRLMLSSRHPMFIWWGPELIQFYNDAYRATMGPERHPSALGDRGRDCWAEIWGIIGPQIERVMRGDGATWNVEQLVPVTRNGARQDVWWTYGYSPIDQDDGVGGVLVVCNDVTDEHLAKVALIAANAELHSEMVRLRDLFRQAPGFVTVLKGAEHIFEFANDAYLRLVGHREVLGKTVREALPEIEGQGFFELMDAVYSTGELQVVSAMPARLARTPDAAPDDVWVDLICAPTRNACGEIDGIFVEGYEVTGRVLAEEQNTLLTAELHHRVKNNLATVISLATLSGRKADSVPEFVAGFTDRVHAMGKTHDLLLRGGPATVLVQDVLLVELAPYLGAGDQVTLDCEEIAIAPAASRSLGLIAHELLTNAAKYGALKTLDGRLAVRCRRTPHGAVLEWHEDAGRMLAPRGANGFGTNLIDRMARDLRGEARMAFQPTGLEAAITFKADKEP